MIRGSYIHIQGDHNSAVDNLSKEELLEWVSALGEKIDNLEWQVADLKKKVNDHDARIKSVSYPDCLREINEHMGGYYANNCADHIGADYPSDIYAAIIEVARGKNSDFYKAAQIQGIIDSYKRGKTRYGEPKEVKW